MNQLEAAEKYGITHEQVYSIDSWFLQSPIPLKDFDLNNSIPLMSEKLNLSDEETMELLQERLNSVMHSKRLMKITKWLLILAIGSGIAYFIN